MPTSLVQAAWRVTILPLLMAGMLAAAPEAGARPYVETAPARGFHLFTRPKKRTPEDQWAYVQHLDRAGKTRAASRHAYALRLYWPNAPEAPAAQMLHARLLERRSHLLEAFDAYQHLVDHYPGRFEFNEVLDRQMALAKSIMDLRKGKILFLPGFTAPERAIPLLEKIVASAPEGRAAAEAYYLIGTANQRIFEYGKAIDAYFTTLNRFPDSPFAEPAARAQMECHVLLADDAPQDNRALETAIAACDFFLQRFPDSPQRPDVLATRKRLRADQSRNAYARARYYDRILQNPSSALIEYRSFLARFPNAEQSPLARRRVEALARQLGPDTPAPPPPEN
ncbi:MAG: tetratricopeptide repeat protein [Lentisphaerae bacterium]|nr:tetratricopeptide repeat protein [Lentisphaerota bacterium]